MTAGVVAAFIGVSAGAAKAADLGSGASDYSRTGSPYDDPRYRAIYGRNDVAPLPRNNRYADKYQPKYARRYSSYRSSDEERRCDPPKRYQSYSSKPARYAGRCLNKREIRRQLRRDGWSDFDLVRLRTNVAVLRARQDGRDLYRLRVDRCSGEVLRSRLLRQNRTRRDQYAYRDRHSLRAF